MITEHQLELAPPAAPKVSESEVSQLLALLATGDWMTAAAITQATGWKDRKIRAVANASGGNIISGQNGYKLTRCATIAEVDHASAWLRHQAKEMTARALQIDRVRHGHTFQ